ncbi:MAG: hypothetical protein RPU73_15635 [Candidatus Sedimenticola sp. (ex Thyasira tokunagai)]
MVDTAKNVDVKQLNSLSSKVRAEAFWETELEEVESMMGVDPNIFSDYIADDFDERVPRQGFVLDDIDFIK